MKFGQFYFKISLRFQSLLSDPLFSLTLIRHFAQTTFLNFLPMFNYATRSASGYKSEYGTPLINVFVAIYYLYHESIATLFYTLHLTLQQHKHDLMCHTCQHTVIVISAVPLFNQHPVSSHLLGLAYHYLFLELGTDDLSPMGKINHFFIQLLVYIHVISL